MLGAYRLDAEKGRVRVDSETEAMIVTDWQATAMLRWAKETGNLQQQWTRETSEIRKYNGRDYLCKGWEHEWRDVPWESAQQHGAKP